VNQTDFQTLQGLVKQDTFANSMLNHLLLQVCISMDIMDLVLLAIIALKEQLNHHHALLAPSQVSFGF
jgi:hypothetical protein